MNNQIIDTVGTHNHEPTANTLEVVHARFQMTTEAKSSSKSTHDVVASGIRCLSDQAIASFLDLHKLKRTIRQIHQKAQNSNILPVLLETLTNGCARWNEPLSILAIFFAFFIQSNFFLL